MNKLRIAVLIALISFVTISAQTKWTLDKAHSKVQFTVTHLVISEVTGQFKSFDANIEASREDFTDAKIDFSADVNSISTDNEGRDKHLKSDDFFNAEKFPKLTFKGKSLTKVNGKNYKLVGDLTIRDITKEVTLDVVFNGSVKDPWGNIVAGFKIKGEINRFDYNLKWNTLIEAGGAVVGKTVEMVVDLELKKSK
ncbi:MAG: polyisoprenoid-binding protein [Ignavibacteriae bacterium HGW-Ignavibacteriae-3]|nr:MAG: polyisoprenoid-binding protein [Ignavibacteriae bacterium HGW-Ignavibacteriae-3]